MNQTNFERFSRLEYGRRDAMGFRLLELQSEAGCYSTPDFRLPKSDGNRISPLVLWMAGENEKDVNSGLKEVAGQRCFCIVKCFFVWGAVAAACGNLNAQSYKTTLGVFGRPEMGFNNFSQVTGTTTDNLAFRWQNGALTTLGSSKEPGSTFLKLPCWQRTAFLTHGSA